MEAPKLLQFYTWWLWKWSSWAKLLSTIQNDWCRVVANAMPLMVFPVSWWKPLLVCQVLLPTPVYSCVSSVNQPLFIQICVCPSPFVGRSARLFPEPCMSSAFLLRCLWLFWFVPLASRFSFSWILLGNHFIAWFWNSALPFVLFLLPACLCVLCLGLFWFWSEMPSTNVAN